MPQLTESAEYFNGITAAISTAGKAIHPGLSDVLWDALPGLLDEHTDQPVAGTTST